MFVNKYKAIELRKKGLSYRAIQKELGVPLSTLSLWLGGEQWSKEITTVLKKENAIMGAKHLYQFKRARGFALQFSYAAAKQDAEKEFKKLKKDARFVAALTLYWVAGDHTSPYYCRLSSTDTQKIRLFKTLLVDYLAVPENKVRCSLVLPHDHNEAEAKEFWSKNTKIPLFCFTKTTFRRKPRRREPNVSIVCTAVHASRYQKEKVLVWLRLLAHEYASKDEKA